MFKNVASQKMAVFAFDTTTGVGKAGDAANITVYVNKDWAGVNALADTSATELDATNAKGWYVFDVSQTETNADALHFTGKSSTANIAVVGVLTYTLPASFTSSVAQTGDSYAVVNSGTFGNSALKTLIDAVDDFVDTEIADIRNRLPAALTANGNLKVSLQEILTTALTEAGAGQLTAAFKKWFDVASPVGTVNSIPNATAGAAGGIAIVGSAMALGANTVDAAALKTDAVDEIVAAIFARAFSAAYSSLTFDQMIRVIVSVLAGKASGLNTGAPTFRNLADSGDVLASTTDTDGNRSAVTITP